MERKQFSEYVAMLIPDLAMATAATLTMMVFFQLSSRAIIWCFYMWDTVFHGGSASFIAFIVALIVVPIAGIIAAACSAIPALGAAAAGFFVVLLYGAFSVPFQKNSFRYTYIIFCILAALGVSVALSLLPAEICETDSMCKQYIKLPSVKAGIYCYALIQAFFSALTAYQVTRIVAWWRARRHAKRSISAGRS